MILGLCPWFGLCPNLLGQRPYQGHSPISFHSAAGEAQPRLTSGGGAVPHWPPARLTLPPSHADEYVFIDNRRNQVGGGMFVA